MKNQSFIIMTCCPPAPPTTKIADFTTGASPDNGGDSIRPDEPVECYAARTGNPTGKHDDATANVSNKIDNSTVPVIRNGNNVSLNEQFKLTAGSEKTASSWEYSPSIPGISFSNNTLSGNFPDSELGKTHKIKVTAKEANGAEIDSRSFTFTPTKETSGDTLKLISPMPGGIVNSKFGMRMHPIHKVMKMHTGLDFKMKDRSVVDIVSAADGEVIYTGTSGSYGNNIKIAHKDSSGKTIGITTYNHLASLYVRPGQKVMAGQKVGKEGSTGASTGNHLHFELKTPEGKFIDPLPFIRGETTVSNKTNDDGDEDPSSLETVHNKNASVSAKEMSAKDACPPPSGPNTPVNPESPNPTEGMPEPPQNQPPGTPKNEREIFDYAWDLTMKGEVGPHWKTSPQFSPGDAELDAGLIDTPLQRKKCGLKNWNPSLGGMTKFGISAASGIRANIADLTHHDCKAIGYNNYWKRTGRFGAPSSIAEINPYIAILIFEIQFQSGSFDVWTPLGLKNLPAKSKQEQLQICEKMNALHAKYIEGIAASKNNFPLGGVMNRIRTRMSILRGFNL